MNNTVTFFISLVLTLIIDYVWLARVMSRFYLSQLGDLARQEGGTFAPLIWPAAIVYLCLAGGITFFVLPRLGPDPTILNAFFWGGFLGLIIYGVYDMTNLALVRDWPVLMSFVDMIWGGVLCGLVTVLVTLISARIQGA